LIYIQNILKMLKKNPGKHPNIDRLLTVMENEEPLDLKIIKN